MKKVFAIVASVLALGAALTASAENHNHDDYLAQKQQAFGK